MARKTKLKMENSENTEINLRRAKQIIENAQKDQVLNSKCYKLIKELLQKHFDVLVLENKHFEILNTSKWHFDQLAFASHKQITLSAFCIKSIAV